MLQCAAWVQCALALAPALAPALALALALAPPLPPTLVLSLVPVLALVDLHTHARSRLCQHLGLEVHLHSEHEASAARIALVCPLLLLQQARFGAVPHTALSPRQCSVAHKHPHVCLRWAARLHLLGQSAAQLQHHVPHLAGCS